MIKSCKIIVFSFVIFALVKHCYATDGIVNNPDIAFQLLVKKINSLDASSNFEDISILCSEISQAFGENNEKNDVYDQEVEYSLFVSLLYRLYKIESQVTAVEHSPVPEIDFSKKRKGNRPFHQGMDPDLMEDSPFKESYAKHMRALEERRIISNQAEEIKYTRGILNRLFVKRALSGLTYDESRDLISSHNNDSGFVDDLLKGHEDKE